MSDPSTTAEPIPPPAGDEAAAAENTPAEEPEAFPREYVEQLRKESAKYRTKASELEQELDGIKQSAMSEAEKAVAEAEARGRSAAATEFGARLARTEFDAAAARRNPDFDTAGALEFVDLTKFVGEDGEPDRKAIQSAVERLVPAPDNGPPSFDGGARTTPPAPVGMNALIRKATGRA